MTFVREGSFPYKTEWLTATKVVLFSTQVFILTNTTAKHTYKFLPSWNVLKYSVRAEIGVWSSQQITNSHFQYLFFWAGDFPHVASACDWNWDPPVYRYFSINCAILVNPSDCDKHGYYFDQFLYAITKTNICIKWGGGVNFDVGKAIQTYNTNHTIKLQILLALHINLSANRFWLIAWIVQHLLTDVLVKIWLPTVN